MQKLLNIIAFLALLPNSIYTQSSINSSLYKLPIVDNQEFQEKEKLRRQQNFAPHFAHPFSVDISPKSNGVWTQNKSGNLVWTLSIVSPNAYSISLGFSEFVLAGNATLSISNLKTKQQLGVFSALENDLHKQLFTPIFDTDSIQIQLEVAPQYQSLIRLRIDQINHAFLPLYKKDLSGECHIDVICGALDAWPIVDDFRDQIRSVALITVNGIGFCTGVLLNNTNNDYHPYFLTAEHCGINSSNAASIIVYWNYENSFCRNVLTEENAQEGDGVFHVFNSGANFLADHNPSDMTLLELDDPIPSEANAFFAGWEANWTSPAQSICIHHPNGEEKRISVNTDSLSRANHFSDALENGNHWRVDNWELGSTENGSSGAPLFNQEGLVIGQLHGGTASCLENGSDWFGALAESWLGEGTPNSQLQYWLSPENDSIDRLGGITLEQVNPLSIAATIQQEINCFGSQNGVVELIAFGGTAPYQYSKDGVNYVDNPLFEELGVGNYLFFVKDANNTILTTSSIELEEPEPLEINISYNLNDVFIEVSGGQEPYEYSLDSLTFQSSNVFLFLEQGSFPVYVRDAKSCIRSTQIELSWDALFVDNRILEEILCQTDSIGSFELIIDGGIPPYGVFLDNDFQSEFTFTEQQAGSYTFLILDSTLDSVYHTVNLIRPEAIHFLIESSNDQIFVLAEGGTGDLQYSLDNIMYQEENFFMNLSNGIYEVFVKDENNCVATDTVSIQIVSINELEQTTIQVSPNPSKDFLHLSIEGLSSSIQSIKIVDMSGHIFWQTNLIEGNDLKISIADFPKGTYLVQTQCDRGMQLNKFIKI